MSNIVDHHDKHIDQGSDDRNTCSMHYQNGEALRSVASANTTAFTRVLLLNTYDRFSAEIVDVRHVPRRTSVPP